MPFLPDRNSNFSALVIYNLYFSHGSFGGFFYTFQIHGITLKTRVLIHFTEKLE